MMQPALLSSRVTVVQKLEELFMSMKILFIRKWVQQLEAERGGYTPTSKALTPEQQRIQ
ncbi:hypothetical protein VR7878_03187 [Vibrio ruber DSM 16370]|uniref:Transposase n=1 Tax=Vibrio ruber (strain DSM 16370 / JCM 11486 / BCRC 17186 / CECT 7878 / LMG 23124 / VR1) TaxID=1123498 RepID=A0A1R4LR15_VIBR1|nr:hypothetical protein VR7878_03187 [Vibrio ruber DSM 16370]